MSHLDVLDRPIAFHRIFRTVSGSTVAALFLSQAWYWSKRLPPDRDGWFYKTQAAWEGETGLSRNEQETARRQLAKVGILEEKREGLPAKLWFRIDRDHLESLIDDAIKYAGIPHTGSPQSSNQECGNAADIHTETTTENTTETQRADAREDATDDDQNEPGDEAPAKAKPPANQELVDIIEAFCDEAGVPFPGNKSTKGKAFGSAKHLRNDGVTPQEIRAIVRWLRADDWWASKGFDLGNVVQVLTKYRSHRAPVANRPTKAIPPPAWLEDPNNPPDPATLTDEQRRELVFWQRRRKRTFDYAL